MSAEFDLVAGATAIACGASPPVPEASDSLDWARVARLAHAHRVVPLVAAGAASVAPRELRATWRRDIVAHAQRALHMVAMAGDIAIRLEATGIRTLAVKGPTLSAIAYGDATRRTFGDLDFWVARADLVPAAACLREAGFDVDARLLDALRRPSRFVQATLTAARDNVAVELHGEAHSRFADHAFDFDDSWARRRMTPVGSRPVATLDGADTLHYLCVHGDWHAWERLQWVADVAVAARGCDDASAEALVVRASRSGHARIVRTGLRLAQVLVPLPMPEPLARWAEADDPIADALAARVLAAFRANAAILRATDRFAFHVRSRQGRARRHYLLWCALTASAADVAKAGLPSRLSWIYPAWRVPRLLARYARPTSDPASRA